MRKILIICTWFLLQTEMQAQKKGQEQIDSLVKVLQTTEQDTVRIKTLNLLAYELLLKGNADTAIMITTSTLTLSKKLHFTRGEADAYFFRGQAHAAKPNTAEALINYESALQLYEQMRSNVDIAETCYALGSIYQRSNYDKALQFFNKGLQSSQRTTIKNLSGKLAYMTAVIHIRKSDYDEAARYNIQAIKYYTESGNEIGLANCYVVSARINNHNGNIQQALQDNYTALRLFEKNDIKVGIYNVYTGLGLMYEDQKNWAEALNSYLAAKKAGEELGNKNLLSGAINNLGNAYRELGKTDEAYHAFLEALKLSEQTNDKKGIATAQGNLGTIYTLTGNHAQALKSYDEARKGFEEIGSKESVAIAYLESGSVYFEMKKMNESKQALENALLIAKQTEYKDVISKSYKLLSQIDTATGNYASALKNYQLYITYRDSISNAEAAKLLTEQRMQYAFSKKEDSMRLQQALIAEQLEKQTLLSKQQQQELKLKQTELELTQKQKDVQMLTFLKTKAELQLSNEQQEKKLALAEQEKALQQSQLEKQTLLAKQKEQESLLLDRKLEVQVAQRNIWLAGAIALLLFSFVMYSNYRQKQKANHLLKQQNLELEDQRDQIKKAMAELQQTQVQLIHKEKMASLGELTAGIAHEIQNPLNFVNNFSEVNVEIGNELREEIKKLTIPDEQMQNLQHLAIELLQNQEKITQHGKRAGAIVKNMLQHSRKSDGAKELTDINALVDECLRLSYHGFRNKDKNFSSRIETHFDKGVTRIKAVPQDLSRVLLNLFNNAFYAVNEHKKQLNGAFEPLIIVSTKKDGKNITITIKDNGTGMSEKVSAKIFQPFFTTKPSGEGTGLGLSLSYDVVTKGHGGDLRVESKEGEGAKFTIQLPA